MKFYDSWKDLLKSLDTKAYFLDILCGMVYWSLIGFNDFYGAYISGRGAKVLPIVLWVIAGILVLLIPLIQHWFRKKYGKKFDI